jgi:hypothetical protein
MPLSLRNSSDPAPVLAPLPGLAVDRETSATFMAALQGRTLAEMYDRFNEGHRAYVATINEVPVAWGWAATFTARIGELDSTFRIPDRERYLWNFVTVKTHRGLGIYPRLVDAIVKAESAHADRFWIAYAPENHASGAGIRKAGFTDVAEISFDHAGHPAVKLIEGVVAAADPARLLGLPQLEEALAQCWKCVRMGKKAEQSCAPGQCRCDYQVPSQGCAA